MRIAQKMFQVSYILGYVFYAVIVFAYGDKDIPLIVDIIGMTSALLFTGKMLYLDFKED